MEKEENKKGLLLESASGFMMPFAAGEDEEVKITLGYGEQSHPFTGKKFFHRGIDVVCDGRPLFAVATGSVIGLGNDAVHDNYIIARYGKYDVKYGHIKEAVVGYGKPLVAGQQIAQGGDFVHIEVTYCGESIDASEFVGMLFSNMMLLAQMGIKGRYTLVNMDVDVKTDYEKDEDEIISMMLRWLPMYMNDLRTGNYVPSERTEVSLRNAYAQSARKNYFYEKLPDLSNPLGLSERSAPLVSKIQNLIISDFLSYMASCHNIYPSGWSDEEKKK